MSRVLIVMPAQHNGVIWFVLTLSIPIQGNEYIISFPFTFKTRIAYSYRVTMILKVILRFGWKVYFMCYYNILNRYSYAFIMKLVCSWFLPIRSDKIAQVRIAKCARLILLRITYILSLKLTLFKFSVCLPYAANKLTFCTFTTLWATFFLSQSLNRIINWQNFWVILDLYLTQ